MTVFEFAVTYAVCWWLVLFMVLPHQAAAPEKPEPGHARSAPANPQIKRKLGWATIFAVIPAVALYFIVSEAKADDMLHAGSGGKGGCTPVAATMSSDVDARDGYSTGGKKVKPATLDNGSTILGDQDHFKIPLLIPSQNYIDRAPKTQSSQSSAQNTTPQAASATTSSTSTAQTAQSHHNVDLSQSFLNEGTLDIGRDGSTTLDGKPLTPQASLPDGCDPEKD